MAQTCSKCSHVNPPDATYCYNDGALLGGHTAQAGALNRGSQPFPSQFVFPSGHMCGNFDQLAMACQQNWGEAVDLLKQGFLSGFLGGLGRADLAAAAQEAARFPDLDRGLDQLLAKLPTQVVQAPKLKAEPTEVTLGIVPMGADRHFELALSNQGMRLLYGSVVSDAKWLTLGEAPGNAQKLFQLRDEGSVPVQVRGQHLRAGSKPLEAQLLIDSNGGRQAVRVRADVPVKKFPEGVLAGATTPRQVAEKAKGSPKEAAKLFESGTVAHWYKDNGWDYPVQTPTASGLGAVQQFFEALGLASAPKVEVPEKLIQLQGGIGQALQHSLEVRTPEKRPIYAHATADQPWLDVGRAKLNGRVANIPVLIPSVPNRPGETLQATVHVTANGNQRFSVPVRLTVVGGTPASYGMPVPGVPVMAVPVMAVPVLASTAGTADQPFSLDPEPAPAAQPFATFAVGAAPAAPVAAMPVAAPAAVVAPRVRRQTMPAWAHLVPAGLLLLALLGTIVKDVWFTGESLDGIPVDRHPRVKLRFDDDPKKGGGAMTFGLTMQDPDDPSRASNKKLTYNERGISNSTLVRIDEENGRFGMERGRWAGPPKEVGKWGGRKITWIYDGQIHVTQTVELIPGEPQIVKGEYKRLVDTCKVQYAIENKDSKSHNIGLRFVLDTYIGSNDGVPFTIPGLPGVVDTMEDITDAKKVPDFIQVLENADLKNPGTIAQVNLKLGGKLEPPERVSLTHWPNPEQQAQFDIPMAPMGATALEKDQGKLGDSAVVLYWQEQKLEPKQVREVGFSYGLGSLESGTGQLAVTVGGTLVVNNELTVVGLVTAPKADEKLRLDLPEGLVLAGGSEKTQPVPPAQAGVNRPSPVTWRVRASAAGTFEITVTSSTGVTQKRRITITSKSLF
jgi:hypothetical protein